MQYTEGYLLDKRYKLERFIGSGSFGEVWVAKDQETDLEVAIKIYIAMDEKGLEEFKKEFQLSFEFNHSNLLHANYFGVNSEDRRPYLVMPFCPEGSVSRFAGQMEEKDLWRFVRDVAGGLAYLHAQEPPIIHQDIKPDNILILRNGDYVITDFGISKQLRQSLRKSAMSLSTAGAISYMGPERFSKNFHAVKASDIWSLGASIYELASGDVPFCGMGGSLQKQGADLPELPSQYSDELNIVCVSCLAKETWDRPTAAQVRDYAAAVLAGNKKVKIPWRYDVPPRQSGEEPVELNTAPAEEETVVTEPAAQPLTPSPEPESPAVAPEEAVEQAGEVNLGEEENVEAPAVSAFGSTDKPDSSTVLSPVVLIIVAVIGLLSGAGLGLLLL